MKVRIVVSLRDGVLDPAAETIRRSLGALGFDGVGAVTQRRVFEVEIDGRDEAAALEEARAMADRLLANPVIETFVVEPVG
ncbi:MAG: phosphoribosylformylglycinamidine synthase subunit PurS [Pseudomonadota bacterium]